ncbi:MAG: hypothetical protein L0228_03875 [Planctomycetes bacterium]|nr:hypothetical protein [Planctomycetota bacterium]
MAKHRSLSNALLSPEKMAFIKGQETNQVDNAPDLQPPVQSNAVVVPVVELAAEASSNFPETQPVKNPSVKRTQPIQDDPIARSTTTPANDDYLVAITTRLQARTADALRRAYLEQKLNRCEPATQQEIIELAVQQWLRKNAFLD